MISTRRGMYQNRCRRMKGREREGGGSWLERKQTGHTNVCLLMRGEHSARRRQTNSYVQTTSNSTVAQGGDTDDTESCRHPYRPCNFVKYYCCGYILYDGCRTYDGTICAGRPVQRKNMPPQYSHFGLDSCAMIGLALGLPLRRRYSFE